MASTTLNVTKDTYVTVYAPSANYGSEDTIEMEGTSSTGRTGLFEFDISSIPSESVITSANLYLYAYERGGTGLTFSVNRSLSQFTENTVAWNTRPSYTTTGQTSLLVNSLGWKSFDVNDIIQDAIDASLSYLGLTIFGDGVTGYTWFRSKEYSSSYDAYVSVTYTAPTPIKINIGDSWKSVNAVKINIGDSWKTVVGIQQNIDDTWKTVL